MDGLIIPESVQNATPIVTCTLEGIIEESDLRALMLGVPAHPQPAGAPPLEEEEDPRDLKKIREKHHSIARMIADGLTQRMAARIAGMSESYVSVLLNSPAMQELVEMYRIHNGAASRVITEKLRATGMKAVEMLDKALDAGSITDPHALTSIAKLGLDRSDHGPSSSKRVIDERHVIDHAELMRQMNEARKGSAEYIVPVAEVRAALAGPKDAGSETEQDDAGNERSLGSRPATSRAGDENSRDEHGGSEEEAA